jgi:hypothetical protein
MIYQIILPLDIHFIILILKLTFYRLILSAVLLSSKFYNDIFYGNHFVAYIGGIHLQEINLLESEFLKFLDWKLWVEPQEYDCYLKGLL